MRTSSLNRRAGMTLVELMVSMVVLLVAGVATLGSLSSFGGLSESHQQTMLAWTEVHRVIEDMYAQDFDDILELYDDEPANDPDGAGTAPGPGFAVAGLDVLRDDPDGFVGQIELPVSGLTPGELYENYVDATFDMPRDLNGDGVVDADDHSSDYALLPVRVRLSWRSRTGPREIEQQVLLLRR